MSIKSVDEAKAFQKRLYDDKVKAIGREAYGSGNIRKLLFNKRINIAKRYIGSDSKVLDFGCGDGTITREIAEKASRVIGIDISSEAIKLAQKYNKLDNIYYFCVAMEEYHTDECFDVITMFESLEHIFNPLSVLEKANRLLKKSGIIVFSTPNRLCLDAYLVLIKRWLFMKNDWKDILKKSFEDHIKEYSLKDIKELLSKSGFKIIYLDGAILSNIMFIYFQFAPFLQKIIMRAGSIAPSIAKDLYIVAMKEKNID